MVRASIPVAGVAALLLPSCAASLYARNSPVLQVDQKTYFTDIASSNYTSIVEFYAPWCGHCKNLQPAYEKAAKSLAGLAKVAAVNCDEESNKPFCGSMGVQGFPTLKIVKPGKKAGKPFVEDYQGPRTAKGIVDAVKDKIPNHVKRLQDGTVDAWLETDNDKPKAILFTEKGVTSALLKSLAIDFLGSISVAQVRNKDTATCERYGITSFPTLILLPGAGAEPMTFKGKLEKPAMLNFLSQAAVPNPDPAPKKSKPKSSSTKKAKAASDSSKLSKASASHRSEDSASARATQTSETVINPEGSPNPIANPDAPKPIDLHGAAAMNFMAPLFKDDDVRSACLTRTSGTCVLLFNPTSPTDEENLKSMMALTALTKIYNRLAARGKTFRFFNVVEAPGIKTQLGVGKDLAVVAVNAKKGWMKRFATADDEAISAQTLDAWIDGLRMGEGKKEPLADGVVVDAPSLAGGEEAASTAPAQPAEPAEPSPESKAPDEAQATGKVGDDAEFDSFLNDMVKEYEASDDFKAAREESDAGAGHDEL